jgi:hypothetical protein
MAVASISNLSVSGHVVPNVRMLHFKIPLGPSGPVESAPKCWEAMFTFMFALTWETMYFYPSSSFACWNRYLILQQFVTISFACHIRPYLVSFCILTFPSLWLSNFHHLLVSCSTPITVANLMGNFYMLSRQWNPTLYQFLIFCQRKYFSFQNVHLSAVERVGRP